MKQQTILAITVLLFIGVIWSSCNKKETAVAPPLPGNEALTSMILKAVNQADPSDTPSAKWVELDPSGATPPDTSHATLILRPNASYNVQIQLLDSLVDVTPEIKDRENYHLFCFDVTQGLNLTCTQTDRDTNPTPLPIGLTDLFITTALSTGHLEVTLHHQPNVKNGQCAPGSIDMDCTFSIKIIN